MSNIIWWSLQQEKTKRLTWHSLGVLRSPGQQGHRNLSYAIAYARFLLHSKGQISHKLTFILSQTRCTGGGRGGSDIQGLAALKTTGDMVTQQAASRWPACSKMLEFQ